MTEHHPKPTVGRIVVVGGTVENPAIPDLAGIVTRVYESSPDVIDVAVFQPGNWSAGNALVSGYAQMVRRGGDEALRDYGPVGMAWDWPSRA